MNICEHCGKFKVDLTFKNKCNCHTTYATNNSGDYIDKSEVEQEDLRMLVNFANNLIYYNTLYCNELVNKWKEKQEEKENE